ncbi:MAG: DUF488 family protein [Ardenticatenaceae bacterium]
MKRETEEQSIFTIGHSNHSLDDFIELLQSQAIDVLVDVRSQPYSRYATHFNKDPLKAGVKEGGMIYLFLGKELGGRPKGVKFYDKDGFVFYNLMAESPLFLEGISRLQKGIQKYRVAIMCSEENPGVCHRHLLVGRVLTERKVKVLHIRGDGQVQTNEELKLAQRNKSRGGVIQLALFGLEEEEEKEWKSVVSVLPKKQPNNSSDY